MQRRDFLRNTALGLAASGLGLGANPKGRESHPMPSPRNLPHWKGFNFLDFFSPYPSRARPGTPKIFFQWMSDWGFDFVRVPMAYPAYLDIDYEKRITPEEVYRIDEKKVGRVDALVEKAHKFGLHVSLNLHRGPGYCINAGFREPFHLWTDAEAQDAFAHHWNFWARRYRGFSNAQMSFDLLNEPAIREDPNDQHSKLSAVPAEIYYQVAERACQAIREASPDRLIIADGNHGGHYAVPELSPLRVAQSCRGYVPFHISHHKASWVYKDPDSAPPPEWPDNPEHNRASLETLYQPWIALKNSGVGVHCGECGCYNKTPHDVFLAWFGDLLDVLAEADIGFALWELKGTFGMLDSGRTDVDYEDWHGYKLDRKLLTLLQSV